jgi:hypothetical protein
MILAMLLKLEVKIFHLVVLYIEHLIASWITFYHMTQNIRTIIKCLSVSSMKESMQLNLLPSKSLDLIIFNISNYFGRFLEIIILDLKVFTKEHLSPKMWFDMCEIANEIGAWRKKMMRKMLELPLIK